MKTSPEELRSGLVWGLIIVDSSSYVWLPPRRSPHGSRWLLEPQPSHTSCRLVKGEKKRAIKKLHRWLSSLQAAFLEAHTTLLLLLWLKLSHPFPPSWKGDLEARTLIPGSRCSTPTCSSIIKGKGETGFWGIQPAVCHRARAPSVWGFSLNLKSHR